MRRTPAGQATAQLRAEAEHRLRAALEARAGAVGPRDLRRAEPPSGARRHSRWRSPRPVGTRATALTLSGLAAALVCVVLLVPVLDRQQSGPAAPASPPASDGPRRTPTPHGPSPAPAPPSAPRPGSGMRRPSSARAPVLPGPVTGAPAPGPSAVSGLPGENGSSRPSQGPYGR